MGNRLKSVVFDSSTVKPGEAVEATISYEGASKSDLVIEAAPGFDVSPKRRALPASGSGEVGISLVVTRVDSERPTCGLVFSYYNSEIRKRVTVK